jgi:phosphatidylglycerol:prolipoprotein diacylglycerol transferase
MFPKLISIGSFFLPTYGTLVAIAFLVSLWLAARAGARYGLEREKVYNLGIYATLAGLAGAKLSLILFDLPYYLEHAAEIFSFSFLQAAGVFQGGLMLALAVSWLYMRRQKMPPLRTCDVFAPGLALGHGIGRLGCFAAGCCWGVPTKAPWAVVFRNPDAKAISGTPLGIPLHPTQLYEASAEFVIAWALLWHVGRKHKEGSTIGLYLVLYSIVRFLVEFVRTHEQELPFGLPLSITQWMSLFLLGVGVYLMVRRSRVAEPGLPAQA